MEKGDSLGDLSEIMGEDYGHGFQADEGDPNIKPKAVAAPTEDESKRGCGVLGIAFQPPKQFLTKLVIQAMPLADVPKGVDPFSMYATTTTVGGKQFVYPGSQPKDATAHMLQDLTAGAYYAVRLVCTNPAGTTIGRSSKPMLTCPSPPPKAIPNPQARSDSIEIMFKPQGQFLTKMKVHASLYRGEGAGTWKKGTFGSFGVGHPTTCKSVIVNKLKPGTKYIFRIETENASGGSIGPTSDPMLTKPATPLAPVEDVKKRSDKQIFLKWGAQRQNLTKLTLDYAVMNGKATFDKMEGGKSVDLDDPQNVTSHLCAGLLSDRNYVFRLRVRNESGESVGTLGGPVKTVEYAPDQHDKSGFLYLAPVRASGKKTIGRRLSIKKAKPIRYWYVLDGKLLSWFNDVKDTDDVGFVHLGKMRSAKLDLKGNQGFIVLSPREGKAMELIVESTDPNITSEQLAQSWFNCLDGAIKGTTAKDTEIAEVEDAPIVRKGVDPNLAEKKEEDEEEFDFGMMDEEGMGFGAEEDEATGFGEGFDEAPAAAQPAVGKDEEEESFGF